MDTTATAANPTPSVIPAATPTTTAPLPSTANIASGTAVLPPDTLAVPSPRPAAAAMATATATATGSDMARSQSGQSTQLSVAEVSEQAAYNTSPENIQVLSPEQLTSLLPPFLRQTKSEIKAKYVDLEWQERNRLFKGLQKTDPPSEWARLTGDEVTRRNRYLNVDPFMSNRVRLKVPEGQNDYINASPITLKSTRTGRRKDYIATQGPKNAIRSHIWHMVWHEKSEPTVIVMLTQTHESGKEKCFPYFPESMDAPVLQVNEEDEFGDGFSAMVTLKSLNEDAKTHSTIRELDLVSTDVNSGTEVEGDGKSGNNDENNKHRTVWHLLFAGWPDFFVPEGDDRAALLALIKLSEHLSGDGRSVGDKGTAGVEKDSLGNKNRNPRIVHCSAGVGRSGTFIALDYLLSEMEDGVFDPVNINVSNVNAVNYGINSAIPMNHTSDRGDNDDGADEDDKTRPSNTNNNMNSNDTDHSDYDDPIADTVDRLRKQRMMMVQTESQYAFLYIVMREAMLKRLEGLMLRGARSGREL